MRSPCRRAGLFKASTMSGLRDEADGGEGNGKRCASRERSGAFQRGARPMESAGTGVPHGGHIGPAGGRGAGGGGVGRASSLGDAGAGTARADGAGTRRAGCPDQREGGGGAGHVGCPLTGAGAVEGAQRALLPVADPHNGDERGTAAGDARVDMAKPSPRPSRGRSHRDERLRRAESVFTM